MKPYLLPMVTNTSVGGGKMMVTTSTMKMTTIFGAAHISWALVSLNVFPTPGSIPGLQTEEQNRWTLPVCRQDLQCSLVLINSAFNSRSTHYTNHCLPFVNTLNHFCEKSITKTFEYLSFLKNIRPQNPFKLEMCFTKIYHLFCLQDPTWFHRFLSHEHSEV